MKTKNLVGKIVWISVSVLLIALFAGVLIGTSIANTYSNAINGYFNLQTFDKVQKKTDDGEEKDLEWYKSSFTDAKGNKDTPALWEYGNNWVADAAAEGATLLWNNENALPLKDAERINLFGIRCGTQGYYYGIEGSSMVATDGNPSMKAACENLDIEVNGKLIELYDREIKKLDYLGNNTKMRGRDNGEVEWSKYTSDITSTFGNYPDAAVVVLGKKTGEFQDAAVSGTNGKDGSYLDLSQAEIDLLSNVIAYKKSGAFEKIVLFLNSDNPISMKNLFPFKNDIDACLWVGCGGRQACTANINLLTGRAAPSGRLVDTYLYDNRSTPAMVNFGKNFIYGDVSKYPNLAKRVEFLNFESNYFVYEESIYVGYRYVETRYEDAVMKKGNASGSVGSTDGGAWSYSKEVAFPFGFGESYCDFEWSDFEAKEVGDNIEVSVTVKNPASSKYSGREVVQVYLQKPYTEYDEENGVEKSAIDFIDFGKTDVLKAGDSQTLKMTVKKSDFKCYDSNGEETYILEKGDYYVTAAKNAHAAVNNILAAKGYTEADGMDENGNASFVKKFEVAKNDFKKYSVSLYTNKKVENQFDDVDVNRYVNAGGNKVTYLTRSDWTGTYPKGASLTLNKFFAQDLIDLNVIDEDIDADDYEFTYGADNDMVLATLRGQDYDNPFWEELLDKLTLDEMVLLCIRGYLSTTPIQSIVAPGTYNYDGPNGLSRTLQNNQALGFPSECVIGATYDKALAKEEGELFGEALLHQQHTQIYAPGVNIHRSAFSGRNGEYYSEDGKLNGVMAAQFTKGVMSKGTHVAVKHLALYDQEAYRHSVGIWANEQSIREIYMLPFEIAVTDGGALGIMSSYNRIGTKWAGGHYGMLTNVLRGEWGFKGYVTSDAFPESTPVVMNYVDSIMAGGDLALTSGETQYVKKYLDSPTIRQRYRESAHRILYVIANSNAMNGVDSDTEIVLRTNWWQYAIVAIDIVVGALMAGAVTMAVLSFVLKPKQKKKEKAVETV